MYLANSMSDLSGWKPEWRQKIFKAFEENPQHIYLLLTKRPGRLFFDITMPHVCLVTTITPSDEVELIEGLPWNVPAKH